jgi:hypothetical protein
LNFIIAIYLIFLGMTGYGRTFYPPFRTEGDDGSHYQSSITRLCPGKC